MYGGHILEMFVCKNVLHLEMMSSVIGIVQILFCNGGKCMSLQEKQFVA